MSEFIQLGGFDEEHQHRSEDLILPRIEGLGVTARIRDSLDLAATLRRGVAVLGPKGSGKTAALTRAIADFGVLEREKASRDAKYQPRKVLRVRGLRAKTYREGIFAVYGALAGDSYSIQSRGRRKTDDELLRELVAALLLRPVTVLVIDEFECTTDIFLELLRDIMSEAEDRDRSRVTAGAAGHGASGIGVLLAGTLPAESRLAASIEAEERWASVVHVQRIPASVVPGIYIQWFPAFQSHVATIGEGPWEHFIRKRVTFGKGVSLRLLETHARMYFRRMVRKKFDGGSRESTPFHEAIFRLTLGEARWLSQDDGADGDTPKRRGRDAA